MSLAALVAKDLYGSRSAVHMQTANSVAMQDRGDGMGHLRACRAAVDGKLHGNKASRTADTFGLIRAVIFAAATLVVAVAFSPPSYAQSGPFAGMAGNWSGAGTVTLDDGSTERIRCRAAYAVGAGGNGLQQTLTCASDSYKFNITTNVVAQGSAVSGTWTETSRNINGNIEGRSGGGNFQVVATAPGFSAAITLTTRGNKQSVVIKAETQFRGVSISMSRS